MCIAINVTRRLGKPPCDPESIRSLSTKDKSTTKKIRFTLWARWGWKGKGSLKI